MAQILTDQHLEQLLCSQCGNYLSVFPIKIFEDSRIKCGRCCTTDEGGIRSHLYEELAEQCLFKCISKYDGCRRLLLPSQVAPHEKTCTPRSCKACPICAPTFLVPEGTGLMTHLKCCHILKNSTFYVTISRKEYEKKFIHIHNDTIFIILLRYSLDCLYISAVTLWDIKNIKQQFIVSMEALKFKETTLAKNCVSLENFRVDDYFKIKIPILNQLLRIEINIDMSNELAYSCEIQLPKTVEHNAVEHKNSKCIIKKVMLGEKFLVKFPNYKLSECGTFLLNNKLEHIELTCSNCKEIMTGGVYECVKKKHRVCFDCRAWCAQCECPIEGYVSIPELWDLRYYCKWNCGNIYLKSEIRNHEKDCYMNKQMCPVCQRIIDLKFLKIHMEGVHRKIFGLVEKYFNFDYFLVKHNMFGLKNVTEESNDLASCCLTITPYSDMTGLELCIVQGGNCFKLINNQISVVLGSNSRCIEPPRCYLKYFH